jgi:hypothetical protein
MLLSRVCFATTILVVNRGDSKLRYLCFQHAVEGNSYELFNFVLQVFPLSSNISCTTVQLSSLMTSHNTCSW